MTLKQAKDILAKKVDHWDLEQQALIREAQRVVDKAAKQKAKKG